MFREKSVNQSKALWKDKEFRSKIRSSISKIEVLNNKFDSSYEVSFWLYCVSNNIHIERNEESYEYTYKGEIHRCTYDFNCVYPDGSKHKIEVKGEHINGKCIYATFDNEQYALIKETYEINNVEYITKEWLESHNMPVNRRKLFKILDEMNIPYSVKN